MNTRLRPLLRTLALVTFVAALLALSAGPVAAEPPPAIEGPVTDLTGELSGEEDAIEDAIQEMLDRDNVQVFVVFVRTTDGASATDYADQVATQNSFGGNDALVLVALEDRTDAIWVADGLDEISDEEIDDVIVNELEPRLADGDFAGAFVAAVEGLGDAADAAAAPPAVEPTPQTQPTPGTEPREDSGGGVGFGTIAAVFALVGGGLLIYRARRSRQGGEERDRRTGELARDANAALISTDERIRDATQEIGFVEAQYGTAETEPFRAAVAGAREELRAAFAIRQKLDDAEPEDPPTREAMLREIVERTTRAHGLLDAQTERIRALRELERDAPAMLEELPARIATVEERLPAAETALGALGGYAAAAWQPVRGNVAEARKGLDGARAAVAEGTSALAAGETARAATATRTALEGVTGAGKLLDAIDRLAATVATAEERAPLELREAERDLADARQAGSQTGDATLSERIRATERAIDAARTAAAARPADPVAALSAATEAHRLADEALLAAREEVAARERLAVAAESSYRTATVAVDRASDFIAARRAGVGRGARTRLAEAERHLEDAAALHATDSQLAIQAAARAERLAHEAYRLASDDFSGWDQGGPGWGGGGGIRTGGGSDLAGAVLGGILGGILSGGGTGGGGWGGSPWGGGGGRSRGGGFPGWGGGGGFGSGGFGGGGFGGGGGRSRGGRW